MKNLETNAFDLVLADPWYGIGMLKNDNTGFAKRRHHQILAKGVDDSAFQDNIPPEEFFTELKRVSKYQIIWGGNYFGDYLGKCVAPIIWDKGTGKNYFADGEMAWTSFLDGCLRIFHHQWCGFYKESEQGVKTIHPCQKPIELYHWIFKKFSKRYHIKSVFDPGVGSGSSRIAAYDYQLDYTGCEIIPSTWKAQEERFKTYIKTNPFNLSYPDKL